MFRKDSLLVEKFHKSAHNYIMLKVMCDSLYGSCSDMHFLRSSYWKISMEKIEVWKTIENFQFKSCQDGVEKLQDKNYVLSEWIKDIFAKPQAAEIDVSLPVKLLRIKVSDFGYQEPTTLGEFYSKLPENGLGLVSPKAALQSRFIYDEQPVGEWLRFATPILSMVDSDGVPHLPKLGKALGLYFIETYWAYENAVFHPHNEFVVGVL